MLLSLIVYQHSNKNVTPPSISLASFLESCTSLLVIEVSILTRLDPKYSSAYSRLDISNLYFSECYRPRGLNLKLV